MNHSNSETRYDVNNMMNNDHELEKLDFDNETTVENLKQLKRTKGRPITKATDKMLRFNSKKQLAQAFLMSECLGPPRSIKPHQTFARPRHHY